MRVSVHIATASIFAIGAAQMHTVFAHHSTRVSYEMDRVVELSGTVVEFRFSNPHSQLYFDVVAENGEAMRWSAELASPGNWVRAGWRQHAFAPGDRISFAMHPAKSGAPVGHPETITMADGTVVNQGGRLVESGTRAGTLRPSRGPAQSEAPAANFDRRDFSGVWLTNHRSTDGYRGMTHDGTIPPRTPWGEAKFNATVTGRGSLARPGVPPVFGNDPIMDCNPYGVPRILFFTRPVEIFHVPGRVLMLFEWHRTLREISVDGRSLSDDPEPNWLGHSLGRWEGDSLVVDTTGFDDRAWLDQYGNVYSNEMRFQERWRRTGLDTLEVTYRIDDPKTYAEPWISTVKTFERRVGWEIREELCAPMDEQFFNRNIRDRAGASDDAPTSTSEAD